MSMSNSEARKRAAEKAVEALKAEVWRQAIHHAHARDWLTDRGCDDMQAQNPYRSEAGR